MINKYILTFQEVSKQDVSLVGGKGANLGELVRAGFTVPAGFCISVKAYQDLIVATGLQDEITQLLRQLTWDNHNEVEAVSQQIRLQIMQQNIPKPLEHEILRAYYNLNPAGAKVAIRSSATAEDLVDASFAGQQDTYLNVQGEQEILHSIKACWASLWTGRALAYRQTQGYDHSKVYLAVVLQEMVEAETAGVTFTVNPLSGQEQEMLISSAYGLGEVVVAGTVSPDTFTLSKKTLKPLNKQLGAKEWQLQTLPGGTNRLVEVPLAKQKRYSLSDTQLKALGQLALRVEQHYQSPQDIEWAFAQGKFHLLQARPITTLKYNFTPTDSSPDLSKLSKLQKFMLDDFIEHYPEAPRCLDYEVVTMSYQALLDCFSAFGIKFSSAKEIVSLNNDGTIRLNPPRMRPAFSKLLTVPASLIKAAKTPSDHWYQFQKEISTKLAQLQELQLDTLTDNQLIAKFEELLEMAKEVCALRFFYLITASCLPVATLSLILKLFISKRKRPVLIDLVTTGLDYQTALIDRALSQLAISVHEQPELQKFILATPENELAKLRHDLSAIPGGPKFLANLDQFLSQYGCRTEKVYQPFAGKAWSEDPGQLLVLLKAVLQDPLLSERAPKELQRRATHQLWVSTFEQKLPAPFRKLFNWSFHKTQTNHLIREETLFALETLFTSCRKITMEIGRRFSLGGYLAKAEDIIYFTRAEIPQVLQAQFAPAECRELVISRQNNYLDNQVLWLNTLTKLAGHKQDDNHLKGIAGSPGLAEGSVQIILGVHDFNKLKKGQILVCPYTDPTWTPLFSLAAAVVADTGGPLSHAAIVAREYGIPAVLGTKLGTSLFKNGDMVVVNGFTGDIQKKP